MAIIAHSTDHDWHPDFKSRFLTRNGSAIDAHEEGNSPVRFPIHFGICEPKISQSKNVGLFRSVFVDELPKRDRCLYELKYLEGHATQVPRRRTGKRGLVTLREGGWLCSLVLLILGGALAAAQEDHSRHQHAVAGLGTVNFPTSCNAAAQNFISRGVALLHSFGYEEARLAFNDAAKAILPVDGPLGRGADLVSPDLGAAFAR